jgi:hypothetical protein
LEKHFKVLSVLSNFKSTRSVLKCDYNWALDKGDKLMRVYSTVYSGEWCVTARQATRGVILVCIILQFMAIFDCNYFKIKHPCPVGKNCLIGLAAMSQATQQTNSIPVSSSAELQALPPVSGPSNITVSSASSSDIAQSSIAPQVSASSTQSRVQDPLNSSMRDDPLLDESRHSSIRVQDPLNSSMRDDPLLDESRHSSSGRSPVDVEMLLELRNINRNIEFLIRNQFEEKERWNTNNL